MSFDCANDTENKLMTAKRRLLEEDPVISPKKIILSSSKDEYSKSKYQEESKKHKRKKEKKSKKKKSKKKYRSSSESSSSSSEKDDWVEKEKPTDDSKTVEKPPGKINPQDNPRDDWMSMMGSISTFSRKDLKPIVPVEKKGQIDAYIPSQSSRELNPYWKDGGTGLPSSSKSSLKVKDEQYVHNSDDRDRFLCNKNLKKPNDEKRTLEKNSRYNSSHNRYSSDTKSFRKPDDDNEREKTDKYFHGEKRNLYNDSGSSRSFKKPSYDDDNNYNKSSRRDREESKYNKYERNTHSSLKQNWKRVQKLNEDKEERTQSKSPSSETKPDKSEDQHLDFTPCVTQNELQKPSSEKNDYLSDAEMNALGAKIVKAGIMGNNELVMKLTVKLEAARVFKKENPNARAPNKEEAVMLTITDDRGNIRPLTKTQNAGDSRSKGGKKKAQTHNTDGERMRFFADDDNYSLKEMFEKEKFENADESEEQFANIISKHRNPNDDLEDIFADNITKNKSSAKSDEHNKNKAISQHQSIQKSLASCEYCIESDKMIKHMIVSLGSKAYVSLPAKASVTEGHCIISTVSHVQCSTMADEDVWSEIMTYRRALTNMFNSKDEDCIFFETASFFHKHPHIVIQCIPLPRDVGDTAPIYFKKALLECEAEWSTNKKVVDLKGKDILRGIPKGLPYFWVDFGMDPGFGHVIEDQRLFPSNFAQEIIGGMLDLHHSLWRKPQKENFDTQRKKTLEFTQIWKSFDPVASTPK